MSDLFERLFCARVPKNVFDFTVCRFTTTSVKTEDGAVSWPRPQDNFLTIVNVLYVGISRRMLGKDAGACSG